MKTKIDEKPCGWWNSKDHVFTEAMKYKTKAQFKNNCIGAFSSAVKHNWLSEMNWFVSGTELYWSTRRKWTHETIYNEAAKYTTLADFMYKSPVAYNTACKRKILGEFTWLKSIRNKNGYWTKEKVLEEAKKYNSRSDFFRGC